MELNTAQQILVVVLATALAIFLVLAIVAAIFIIRLLQTLRLVADKAEKVIESAEAVGDVFKKAAGPLGALRLIRTLIDTVGEHKQHKDK